MKSENIDRMKKILPFVFVMMLLMFTAFNSFSDTPPPPPSGGHGQGGNLPPGGGAPTGSGMVLLISLAIGYGGKKVYGARNKKLAKYYFANKIPTS